MPGGAATSGRGRRPGTTPRSRAILGGGARRTRMSPVGSFLIGLAVGGWLVAACYLAAPWVLEVAP